jgi:hypothetical protein
MPPVRIHCLAWLVVVSVVATACGASDRDPRDTVKAYVTALADDDGAKACDQLTAGLRSRTLEHFRRNYPGSRFASCASGLELLADNAIQGDHTNRLRDAHVDTADVEGDAATVALKEGGTVTLEKVDGQWLIDGGSEVGVDPDAPFTIQTGVQMDEQPTDRTGRAVANAARRVVRALAARDGEAGCAVLPRDAQDYAAKRARSLSARGTGSACVDGFERIAAQLDRPTRYLVGVLAERGQWEFASFDGRVARGNLVSGSVSQGFEVTLDSRRRWRTVCCLATP